MSKAKPLRVVAMPFLMMGGNCVVYIDHWAWLVSMQDAGCRWLWWLFMHDGCAELVRDGGLASRDHYT
jgi:hypothetical protein